MYTSQRPKGFYEALCISDEFCRPGLTTPSRSFPTALSHVLWQVAQSTSTCVQTCAAGVASPIVGGEVQPGRQANENDFEVRSSPASRCKGTLRQAFNYIRMECFASPPGSFCLFDPAIDPVLLSKRHRVTLQS